MSKQDAIFWDYWKKAKQQKKPGTNRVNHEPLALDSAAMEDFFKSKTNVDIKKVIKHQFYIYKSYAFLPS